MTTVTTDEVLNGFHRQQQPLIVVSSGPNTTSAVALFLKTHKLQAYSDAFQLNGYEDMEDMPALCKDREMLAKLMPLPGHQAKFMRVVSEWSATAANLGNTNNHLGAAGGKAGAARRHHRQQRYSMSPAASPSPDNQHYQRYDGEVASPFSSSPQKGNNDRCADVTSDDGTDKNSTLTYMRSTSNLLSVLEGGDGGLHPMDTSNRLPSLRRNGSSLQQINILDHSSSGNPLSSSSPGKQGGAPASSHRLYNEPLAAAANHRKIVVRRHADFKLVVVGQGGVGKTALINRLVHHSFNGRGKCTIGVEFTTKTISVTRYVAVKGNPASHDPNQHYDRSFEIITDINLQFWDIAGQEDCGNATRMYYHNAKAAIVVYDATDPNSLTTAIRWKRDIDTKVHFPCVGGGGQFAIPSILVANKTDALPYVLPLRRKFVSSSGGGGGNSNDSNNGTVTNVSLASTPTTPPPKFDFPLATSQSFATEERGDTNNGERRNGPSPRQSVASRGGQRMVAPPTEYKEESFNPHTILSPPETIDEVQNFVNAFRFAGHCFVSAKSGAKMEEMCDFVVTCVLKMDPHGTDEVPPNVLKNPDQSAASSYSPPSHQLSNGSVPLRGRELPQKPKKKKSAFRCLV